MVNTFNPDFYKELYRGKWDKSSAREEMLANIIFARTGCRARSSGLGAGSTEFIHGSAEDNGHHKGDADLSVDNTNIYIEVTGPLTLSVDEDQKLWFRPDKIENAINHKEEHDTFLAHHLPKTGRWRIIHVDEGFINDYLRGSFPLETKDIRGVPEKYNVIPAEYPHFTVEGLIQYIKAKVVCPNCGAELEIKDVRNGSRAGKQILACPNYPKCRGHIINIE